MEIHALGALNEKNSKLVQATLESYRRLMFPGSADTSKTAEDEITRRKAALAKEAQKAFIVKPIDTKAMLNRGRIDSPEVAKLAGRAMADAERARMKELSRRRRMEMKQSRKRKKR